MPRSTKLPREAGIFERQRLPRARQFAAGDLDTLAAEIGAAYGEPLAGASAWTLHSFAPNPDAEDSRTGEAQRLEQRLLARLRTDRAELGATYRPPLPPPDGAGLVVLQVCRTTDGAWCSLAPLAELSDAYPGGVHRMPNDPLAPSRSYLKIEEALDTLGVTPRPNDTVVDLGAAPGGWSYAFAKRGCRVTAVDNGPLKLRSLGDWGGEVIHAREDGLRYRPARPVDWLLSDMLIAPGQALGLLRKWLGGAWARRCIVNLKLPQEEPLVALAPVREFLAGVPRLRFQLRQLYHDRREVTLMAELAPGAAPPRGNPAPRRPPPRDPRPPGRGTGPRKRGTPRPGRGRR